MQVSIPASWSAHCRHWRVNHEQHQWGSFVPLGASKERREWYRRKKQKQRGAKVQEWIDAQYNCQLRIVWWFLMYETEPLRSWTTSLRTSACVSCDCCKGGGPFRLKVWENKYDLLDLYLVVRPFPQVFLLRMAMIGWAREPLDIYSVSGLSRSNQLDWLFLWLILCHQTSGNLETETRVSLAAYIGWRGTTTHYFDMNMNQEASTIWGMLVRSWDVMNP